MTIRERLTSAFEDATGLTIAPKAMVARLAEDAERLTQFQNEASELAYWTLDYFGGRPQEMVAERRVRLAQRSRVAFLHDPLAGAEADLRSNFAFGQGVAPPKAADEAAQKVLDRAWTDPNNEDKLTSFAAQRRSSNTLITQGELFDLLFVAGGRVRVGKLDADQVIDIVPDPEDRLRPLYYIAYRRTFRWDVENDRPAFELDSLDETGKPKVTYYPHWRNLADAEAERERDPTLEALPVIPEAKKDPGGAVVYHTAINQLDEQLRGNPPWARTLRFYSAMNQFTEARVSMAQAASTFIAKRVTKGSQSDIVKAAGSVLAQTGELGAARYADDPFGAPVEPQTGQVPPSPGAWWHENEQTKLESLSLQSGAAAAQQDAQIIRAPLAAASQFGQHYLGDAGNANLATATSLELPSLMGVLAWQEMFEQRFRWFADRAIEAAIRAGELGGSMEEGDGRRLDELRLAEQEDRDELEQRTGKDLSYTFAMPYPGRRNLPDVTGSVSTILQAGEGILAENEEFMEQALLFLFTHGWQLDDPAAAVERVMEKLKAQLKQREEMAEKIAQGAEQGMGPGAPRGTGAQGGEPAGRTAPKREMGAGPMGEQEWIPAEMREPVAAHAKGVDELFVRTVLEPAAAAAAGVGPSANGHGAP